MDWIKVKMYRDQLHRERIRQHGQTVAPVHLLEANAKVVHGRRSQFLSARQKLAWLMLGVVSGALIVIVAWWSELNELGGGARDKGMVSSLMEHRQSGELPAQSFTTEGTREDITYGVISRLEVLPPTAAGMGNDNTSAGKDKDKSGNATSSTLLSRSDNLPVTTEVQPHETIRDTGPAMSAVPFADDTLMRLQKLAEYGDASAQFNLGEIYATGDGVPENTAKAAEWYQKSAAQGDASAQFKLGVMYRVGEGVPENAARAAELFEKAATQGNVYAQYNLGVMYDTGDGVPMEPAKAMEWLQKAAAQGDAKAQNKVGIMYSSGDGVPMDPGKAMEWFQKSAMQGYSNAQFNLGMMYATGEGVPKNAAKAAEWFKKAAAQGDADAQFKLGVMYRIGEGVPKNAAKAAEWFQKAAAQGNADAQFNLGVMYNTDEGVSKD
jgi:TPR repeat protein